MPDERPRVIVVTDRYPELSETFVANEVRALERLGFAVRVESVARPQDPAPGVAAGLVWEDESTARRAVAIARLAARRPLAVLRDLRDRSRWRREEPVVPLRMLAPSALRAVAEQPAHLHVHFAAGAALSALRIARLTGIPYSLTAHAYDIYQRPANLAEKLRCAAFATSGCDYTVAELRRVAGDGHAVHRIVMGVHGGEFSRRRPYPGGRTVVAVGRLVEKKGFGDLIEAAALMRRDGRAPDRVRIVGDGPLRAELAGRVEALGLGDVVELTGARPSDGVRAELEGADVLCMPCVVARDGDRDSMPVVVKEALAMEVPVVATDEVGLPEVVREPWGRLAPPGDPAALARALAEVLDLPAAERAAMGAAGRAHVLVACDVDTETARLAALIAAAQRRSSTKRAD